MCVLRCTFSMLRRLDNTFKFFLKIIQIKVEQQEVGSILNPHESPPFEINTSVLQQITFWMQKRVTRFVSDV